MGFIVTHSNWDKDRWPNFSPLELECSFTGNLNMDSDTLDGLQMIRDFAKQAKANGLIDDDRMFVSSGFRDLTHPEEVKKGGDSTAPHPSGKAVDIRCSHRLAYYIVTKWAHKAGFTGIGVSQNGDVENRFIHLDRCFNTPIRPRPHVWTY